MAEVVIVGKPNVGKSTLFNRLIGKRKAIVDNVPGVTRDIIRDVVETDEGVFFLSDTGGIFEKARDELGLRVKSKVFEMVENSDLILFVVDGRSEPTSEDFHIAEFLRKFREKTILVANKVENRKVFEAVKPDIYSLGFGEPIPVSAEHGLNTDILLELVIERLTKMGIDLDLREAEDTGVKVAIVGKPNAGKSSLFNAIIGKDRAIVTPAPGTTRDIVDETVEIGERRYIFLDTAGLRRKSRIESGTIERYGSYRSIDALERADVVVLVVDPSEGITRQDQRLAGLAERRGKATVVVFSKWDTVERARERTEEFRDMFLEKLYFIDYSPLVFTSALEGWGIDELLDAIDTAYDSYTTRVSSSRLNRELEKFLLVSPPPTVKGRKLRIYFGMQVDVKPPTFLFFTNRPGDVPESYKRSLKSMIRKGVYHFTGSPVFIRFKKSRK